MNEEMKTTHRSWLAVTRALTLASSFGLSPPRSTDQSPANHPPITR